MITARTLRAIAPKADQHLIERLAPVLEKHLAAWTPLEQAHFLAQAAHETAGFRTLEEYGGPSYFKRYEGRKDLGNVKPGDGVLFHGRGIFQLTGRANYEAYGRKLGLDLVARPERAADPEISTRIALAYWDARGIGAWALRDDINRVTRKINGGLNGLNDRARYLAAAKRALSPAKPITKPSVPPVPMEEVPEAPIAAEPAKRWWESTTILATLGSAAAGIAGTLKALVVDIDTPYEVAALGIAMVIIGGCAAWVIRERMRKEPA